MLKINDTKYKILSSEIKYVSAIQNAAKGYSILVSINIELNNIKRYISFYVDFFDTKDFVDFIDSEVNLNINDELIKLFYKGKININ